MRPATRFSDPGTIMMFGRACGHSFWNQRAARTPVVPSRDWTATRLPSRDSQVVRPWRATIRKSELAMPRKALPSNPASIAENAVPTLVPMMSTSRFCRASVMVSGLWKLTCFTS